MSSSSVVTSLRELAKEEVAYNTLNNSNCKKMISCLPKIIILEVLYKMVDILEIIHHVFSEKRGYCPRQRYRYRYYDKLYEVVNKLKVGNRYFTIEINNKYIERERERRHVNLKFHSWSHRQLFHDLENIYIKILIYEKNVKYRSRLIQMWTKKRKLYRSIDSHIFAIKNDYRNLNRFIEMTQKDRTIFGLV